MRLLIFTFFIFSCSSSTVQLSEKAKELEVYPVKPQDCRVVGKFTGVNKMGSKELALNDALNQAATVNATGVYVNQEVPNGKLMNVFVTAYQCD